VGSGRMTGVIREVAELIHRNGDLTQIHYLHSTLISVDMDYDWNMDAIRYKIKVQEVGGPKTYGITLPRETCSIPKYMKRPDMIYTGGYGGRHVSTGRPPTIVGPKKLIHRCSICETKHLRFMFEVENNTISICSKCCRNYDIDNAKKAEVVMKIRERIKKELHLGG
jgi:hypothetical protein